MNDQSSIHRHSRKSSGQGMVEFALAIPLFLMLVFGVLELGRLIFTYSAVFSAAREAARYGAAVGVGPNGRPYFQDCRGMRDAAIRIGNLAALQDGDITIVYDNPDTGKNASLTDPEYVCDEANGKPLNGNIELGDRVIVTVQITYEPIVGFLGLPDFDIRSTSRRTIVRNVQLDEAIGMALPSQTIDPSVAPGLTQTSAAITATAAAAPPEEDACPVPDSFKVPFSKNGSHFKFTVSNPVENSDAIKIESMTIHWENPGSPPNKLSNIRLEGSSIWSAGNNEEQIEISSWLGTEPAREIASGGSKELSFTFDKKLTPSDINNWWVSIQFSGACEEAVTWTGQE